MLIKMLAALANMSLVALSNPQVLNVVLRAVCNSPDIDKHIINDKIMMVIFIQSTPKFYCDFS